MISAERTSAISRRQRVLLTRSAELRERLAAELQLLAPPLRWADRLHAGWRWLLAHPAVPAALLVAMAVLRPRRALRWGLRLWWGWRALERLKQRLQPPG